MHSFSFSKVRLAGLASLLLIFSACSHLDSTSSVNINFKINVARTALSEIEGVKVTIDLKGGVEQSQTKALDTSKKTAEFSFTEIPVGTELYAQAEIFVEVDGEKKLLYSGKSETKTITEGTNEFKINLEKLFEDEEEDEEEDEKEIKFNIVTKTDTTYVVENPTFIVKKIPLSTNEISFNLEKDYEEFLWQPDDTNIKLNDYQKAIITYKGTTLKTDEENVIAFKAKRADTRNYYRDQKPVTDESQTYEMKIPQGTGPLVFGIENKWDNDNKKFQKDFTFEVEKIELIKDPTLAIDYTKSTYTVEGTNIELLRNINNETDWSIGPNTIKYTSKEYEQNGNDSGWAAAYWEFDRLSDYNKAVITVKGLNPNSYGMKFTIGSHLPWYKRIELGDKDADLHSKEAKYVELENENESVQIEIDLADLNTFNDNGTIKEFTPVAIEFINQANDGTWTDDMVWGDDWTLVIEKIELKKEEPELYGWKPINVNDNWHTTIFNEYRDIISLKSATDDSITFTIYRAFTQENSMVQVVYGDDSYLADTMYVCSYKLKGPDTNIMNVCAWVPRDESYTNGTQANLESNYNSSGFTEHSFMIPCDTTNSGGILFFPITPGEYTISDVSVTSIVKKDLELEINLPETNDSDISVSVTVGESPVTESGTISSNNTSSVVFTADAGYDTYIWKVDGETKLVTTNTYTLNLSVEPFKDAPTGTVFDITLLAQKGDEYHSYSAQVKIQN